MAEAIETGVEPVRPVAAAIAPRRPAAPREHHVERDFGYVRRDLLLVAGVGTAVIAFIVGVSFVL